MAKAFPPIVRICAAKRKRVYVCDDRLDHEEYYNCSRALSRRISGPDWNDGYGTLIFLVGKDRWERGNDLSHQYILNCKKVESA